MSTVKLSKVLSELPAKDSVADNDNFVLSSYQKLPASQLATAEQLSAAKQTAADGLTSLKSALKGIANTDCARVVITASGNYAVTTNLDALSDFSTAAGLYALVSAKNYVYGHMLIGSDPMFHGTVQWLIGNWNVESGKLMVSHSDGCATIVYRVYLRSDAKWSDWKYYQQNFLKEKADTANAGEWTYTHTAIDAMKTSLQAAIDSNAAAIAALDSQVNDTRHHLIVKTTKDLTIVVDGKYVKIPAKAKTDIFFKSTAYGIPYASHVVCHFQLLNTSGMTMYPCIYSNKVSHIDVRDWDMSKVTSIYRQFNLCSRIHDLDVSGWDTSRISEMEGSFWGCSSLTTLDVSGWDTSKVVHMNRIFEGCSSLTTLDVSGWDTGAVTNMLRTFFGCSSLTTLDLTNWDTTSTTNFSELFSGCLALANLTLGALFFATKTSTTISFASLSKWTNDTVRTSLVTNLYDRAANGLGTITLQLHANTKAVLSTEDKEYITSKGYIIA